MLDHVLTEAFRIFAGPALLLALAGLVVLQVLRAALNRFAPRWMVGPNGLQIDTTTGHGMFQIRPGPDERRAAIGHGGDMPSPDCR